MYLDKRSLVILQTLISNPNITSKDLELKNKLSRRQIKYSIEKINNWLVDNNYPKIQRLTSGNYLIDTTLMELFTGVDALTTENYIPSENERVILILFILLSQKDLSLFHFTNALKVSNVTVLNDMKKAQKKLREYRLKLIYSRTEGYHLEGEEWNQRNLILDILHEIRNVHGGLSLIQDFTMIQEEKINNISIQLEKIEEILKIKFTDEKMQMLPYSIGIILERVRNGENIQFDFQIKNDELSDLKEYEATKLLVKNEKDFPEIERLYITLQLLATNIFSSDLLTEQEIPQLKIALYETLNNFEANAFLELKNKDNLVQKLMLHLKPAYYRIKYNMTSLNKSLVNLEDTYLELDQIVKLSLSPLEKFMKNKIPEIERKYLTIFIGGHLLESKQIFMKRKKALVVCQNGVTISKLLRNSLTKLFPEFDFYPTKSMREFTELDELDAAIIFSPIPVRTDKDLFIINPLLTEEDKWKLRQRVMKRIYGVDNNRIKLDELIEVIEKSSTINNREILIEDLQRFLQTTNNNEGYMRKDSNPNLDDLITEETITVLDKVTDWKEAIKIASMPLLRNGSITEEYVKKMIMTHNYKQPYMILGEKMAIPHAEPDDGVNKLGMSLLIVKDGVLFSSKLNIHFVVVIAPTGAEQHVKAIYQLSNLSMSEEVLNELLVNSNKEVVVETIKKIKNDKIYHSKRGEIS